MQHDLWLNDLWLNDLWLISGMALVTFAIRYLPIALSGQIGLSPRFVQILRYVPPVVLTAIVVPAVLIPSGTELALNWTNPRLVGAIGAIAVTYWRKNLLLTIVLGMGLFFTWQALLPPQ